MDTVLEVVDIVTRFGSDTVHDGVSFSIPRGEVVALIGGSGTGKSVLLKEMIGLMRPTSGRVHLLGTDVQGASEDEMNALRRRFGMLFQDGALFSSLSVADNIAVPLREHTSLPESASSSRSSASHPTSARRRRRSSRAECESASRSPARWRSSRKSCSSTSRPRASTRSARAPSTRSCARSPTASA